MTGEPAVSPTMGPADARGRAAASARVGMFALFDLLERGTEAAHSGRLDPPVRHGMQVWCGLADSKEAARACLAPAMETFYQLPFERFERYCPYGTCPYGTADDVAEFLAPYVDAGCTEFNLIPQSPDHDLAIAGAAAVKGLLA